MKNEDINYAAQFLGDDLYLDVTLNKNPEGVIHFGYVAGKFYASAYTLRQLGFRVPENTTKPICLNDIAQLHIDYNVQQQSLALVAPLQILELTTTQLNTADLVAPVVSNSRGALINYDIHAEQGKESRADTFSELRVFDSLGVLSSTQLTQYSTGNKQDNPLRRLDTRWRSAFVDKMLAVTLGDTLTSALPWTRSTRVAGIQIGTDFGLQPYMPTTPLPQFLGSAALPSSVELYLNGVKSYQGEVPAGDFQINSMPNISGAGNAQVVMTDVLGRTRVQSFSFYNDPRLLREGLTDWSTELGLVREDYGYSSFDYANSLALSGTWRHGVSNTLTSSIHGEASERLFNAGFGSDWIPDTCSGTFSTALAMSTDAGDHGFQLSANYRWSSATFNFSTNTIATSGIYHDVATHYSQPPPMLNSSTVIGYATTDAGNFNLSYLQFRHRQENAVRYTSISWYKSVTNNISLNTSFNQNVDDHHDRSIYLMLTLTNSDNLSASSTIQHASNGVGYQLGAGQSPQAGGGWNWNVTANQQASQQSGQGEIGYLGHYGKAYTGFGNLPGNRYGYAGATGSLVMMDGDLFAAREINNGFAVVSTDGIPNVPIKLQNNFVGNSDEHGRLLVTSLNSYQENQISIDPMDLPANMRITRVVANATPADRAGTLVNFGITPTRAGLIALVDSRGKVIPEGSVVTLSSDPRKSAVVGFDGMVYFDSLGQHNHLQVTTDMGVCGVRFDYPGKTNSITQIGPLVCQ